MGAQLVTFTPLGAPGPATYDQRGSPSRFSPLPLGPFSDNFLSFLHVFMDQRILWKLSPRPGESSILQVQAAPNVTFSPLEPLPKIKRILEAHEWGRGDPPEKLERTRGPSSCRQNAYRDRHPLRPKRTTPRRCLGTRLGTVGKEPWSPSKAQNIKEGIYIYIYIVDRHK